MRGGHASGRVLLSSAVAFPELPDDSARMMTTSSAASRKRRAPRRGARRPAGGGGRGTGQGNHHVLRRGGHQRAAADWRPCTRCCRSQGPAGCGPRATRQNFVAAPSCRCASRARAARRDAPRRRRRRPARWSRGRSSRRSTRRRSSARRRQGRPAPAHAEPEARRKSPRAPRRRRTPRETGRWPRPNTGSIPGALARSAAEAREHTLQSAVVPPAVDMENPQGLVVACTAGAATGAGCPSQILRWAVEPRRRP